MSEQPKKTYWFKSPGGKRRSFALCVKLAFWGGERRSESAVHPEVTDINAQYRAGLMTLSAAALGMTLLCQKLNQAERGRVDMPQANTGNVDIFNAYWEKHYKAKRNRGKQSHWYAFQHLLNNLGSVDVLGEANAVFEAIEKANPNPNEQCRYLSKANTLRKEHKKAPIPHPDKQKYTCRHLTEPEFLRVLPHVEGELYQQLFSVLFGTGVRQGEALAITPELIDGKSIYIGGQIRRDNKFGDRKNSKNIPAYHAIVLPHWEEALKAWAKRPDKYINRHGAGRIMKRACKKVFPNDPSKWLTAHDLRHCFCIYLLTVVRFNVTTVAQLIGDTPEMVINHYGRFVKNDDFTNAVLRDIAAASSQSRASS